jgi:DNA-binding NarL/FixJ family response regulator
MIRIVVIDDHPALRAGLHTVLESEPGLVVAGESSGTEETVWPVLNRSRPDLVLLDYHLPHSDGLQLCYRIKGDVPAPKVVIFTEYATQAMALPAAVARADALLHKGVGARELFEAIRLAHRGERLLPPISHGALEESASVLDPDERALVGMLLDGSTETEIAKTLRVAPSDVRHRVHRILSAMRLEVPAGGPG